ncbi:hypothetical protein ACQKWADRAFT_331402 [Trichoderma austrokoningii]
MATTIPEEVEEVFPAGYSAPRSLQQLMQYHKEHLTTASVDPIISTHNINERLQLIEEIWKGIARDQKDKSKAFQFTYFELAYFLLCPEASLRKVIADKRHDIFLQRQIKDLESVLLSIVNESYVTDNSHRKENSEEQNRQCDERKALLEESKKNLQYKRAEQYKCVVRDGFRCILTQNKNPKVYQILPFIASYGNWTMIQALDISSCLNVVLGSTAWIDLNCFVCIGADRCDKVWNMICLGPDLRNFWKEHFFGIQCLGVLPIDGHCSAIWLQFHWMPRNQLNPSHCAELDMDTIQKMQRTVSSGKNDTMEKARGFSHRLPVTGKIISIRMGRKEALSMKQTIDVRWLISKIAAISGLARSKSRFK